MDDQDLLSSIAGNIDIDTEDYNYDDDDDNLERGERPGYDRDVSYNMDEDES